jgi:hypothetical protein
MIVTGIPRSGTSYFTSTLHRIDNCVAINEPEEIFRHLDDTSPPWGMASCYRFLRDEIRNGRPVKNKIADGKVIEDTAVIDLETSYVPAISSSDFLLATKNTLGYLARLRFLAQALPEAVFVACVRHPFTTIASWKGTFHHLREAAPQGFRKGFLGDEMMRPAAQERLQDMAHTPSFELRRALLWNHLALLILEDRAVFSRVFRYEDFVVDPGSQLRSLLEAAPGAPPFRVAQPLTTSQPRTNRADNLTPADLDAIRSVCTETAAALGYDLEVPPTSAR